MGILVGSFHPLATSTRHTGEWLTDRNILRVKDLRNQPPARRHSPRTHSVQLSTATPRWSDYFKNQKSYASDEMPIQHDGTEAHRPSADDLGANSPQGGRG